MTDAGPTGWPEGYRSGIPTGEWIPVTRDNVAVLLWDTLRQMMDSHVDLTPAAWSVDSVASHEALPEHHVAYILPSHPHPAVKPALVGALAELGIKVGRVRNDVRYLYVWTADTRDARTAAHPRWNQRVPEWCADFYEQHIMANSDILRPIVPLVRKVRAVRRTPGLIHRGEHAPYQGDIKSTLRRLYDVGEATLADAQETIARSALEYVDHGNPTLALMEAQHMGIPTNLIDFTTDPMVALFFASSKSIPFDGRVVSIKADHPSYTTTPNPGSSVRRMADQCGVFVETPSGALGRDLLLSTIQVPVAAKRPLATYLKWLWGLSRVSVFRDLSGLADEFAEGMIRLPKALFEDGRLALHRDDHARAVDKFTEYIDSSRVQHPTHRLGGKFAKPAYVNRAIALEGLGRTPEALKDLDRALITETEGSSLVAKEEVQTIINLKRQMKRRRRMRGRD